MKPHRKAEMSFGQMLLVVLGLVFAAGMSGAFSDDGTPPPDLSKIGQVFDAPKDAPRDRDEGPAEGSKRPTKRALEMCPDDPYHCWWQ